MSVTEVGEQRIEFFFQRHFGDARRNRVRLTKNSRSRVN